jgi:hypothetical protein
VLLPAHDPDVAARLAGGVTMYSTAALAG